MADENEHDLEALLAEGLAKIPMGRGYFTKPEGQLVMKLVKGLREGGRTVQGIVDFLNEKGFRVPATKSKPARPYDVPKVNQIVMRLKEETMSPEERKALVAKRNEAAKRYKQAADAKKAAEAAKANKKK